MNFEPLYYKDRQKKKPMQMEEKRSDEDPSTEGENTAEGFDNVRTDMFDNDEQEEVYEDCLALNKEGKDEKNNESEDDYIDMGEPSSGHDTDIYVEGEYGNEEEAVYEDTAAVNEAKAEQSRNFKAYKLNYEDADQSLPEGDLDNYGEEEDIYQNFQFSVPDQNMLTQSKQFNYTNARSNKGNEQK